MRRLRISYRIKKIKYLRLNKFCKIIIRYKKSLSIKIRIRAN
jgi:hypothetical protein